MFYYCYVIVRILFTLLSRKINNKETGIIPRLRFHKNKNINFGLHYFHKNQLKNNNNLHFEFISRKRKKKTIQITERKQNRICIRSEQ